MKRYRSQEEESNSVHDSMLKLIAEINESPECRIVSLSFELDRVIIFSTNRVFEQNFVICKGFVFFNSFSTYSVLLHFSVALSPAAVSRGGVETS